MGGSYKGGAGDYNQCIHTKPNKNLHIYTMTDALTRSSRPVNRMVVKCLIVHLGRCDRTGSSRRKRSEITPFVRPIHMKHHSPRSCGPTRYKHQQTSGHADKPSLRTSIVPGGWTLNSQLRCAERSADDRGRTRILFVCFK